MVADAYYMRKALALAERGRAAASPNPIVGALVVSPEGVIVGRGSHRVAGGPHAEVLALEDAGPLARGGTLYCTLEPCNHTGRTGPCAPVVAAAGVRRVVVAMGDPNPLVNGAGLDYLRSRGIDVTLGVHQSCAERQNEAFLTRIRRRRPLVIVKVALSVDGYIAAAAGSRTQLTGAAANRFIHRQRAEVDAIAVGSGTVLTDDPLLTPRGAFRGRPLIRVIFDRRLRTPPAARVFSTLVAGPVIIVSTERQCARARKRVDALSAAGADVMALPVEDIGAQLRALGEQRELTSLVLEGGATVHRAALDAGVVDLVQVYITPRRLGPDGLPWMDERRFTLAGLYDRRATWLGDDVLVEGHVHRAD